MDRYDRGWTRGYGREYGISRGGYGVDYYGWGGWGDISQAGIGGRGMGWRREGAMGRAPRGYDRGVYGGDHPGFGGYPGGQSRGMYYGGRGYGAAYGRGEPFGQGYGGPSFGRGGYDEGFSRRPFLTEEVYREHPELDRQPHRQVTGRWPGRGYDGAFREEMSDEEIRQAVETSLQMDNWVHADKIQVDVDDQVVTLRGEVADYMEARYAWDDAWEAAGVRGVVNQLTVRTDEPMGKHGEPFPQHEGAAKTTNRKKK